MKVHGTMTYYYCKSLPNAFYVISYYKSQYSRKQGKDTVLNAVIPYTQDGMQTVKLDLFISDSEMRNYLKNG